MKNDTKVTLFESQAMNNSTSKETIKFSSSGALMTPGISPICSKMYPSDSYREHSDEFHEKMAKVVEDCQGDEPIEGYLGSILQLRWLIQNKSRR